MNSLSSNSRQRDRNQQYPPPILRRSWQRGPEAPGTPSTIFLPPPSRTRACPAGAAPCRRRGALVCLSIS